MTGHDWKILPEPFRSTFKSRNRLFFLLKAIIVETVVCSIEIFIGTTY